MFRSTANYAQPLPLPDERRAVALALALVPVPDALDRLDTVGTAPTPTGDRRTLHPIIHRAGWLILRWAALQAQQERGAL